MPIVPSRFLSSNRSKQFLKRYHLLLTSDFNFIRRDIVVVISKSFVVVRSAESMIVERWGKYSRTLTPGLHFLIPFADSLRMVDWRYLNVPAGAVKAITEHIKTPHIDMREHVIDFEKRHCITKDTCQIDVDALVYYRVRDPRLCVFNIVNLPDAIELLTQSTLRNIIAQMTLDETFSSRERVNSELLSKVAPDAERWGVTIIRVEIQNIMPPKEIKKAMEKQIKEERERRATVLTADGERQAEIVRSKGTAMSIILKSQANKTSSIQISEGKAKAKELDASSNATSLHVLDGVLPQGLRSVDFLSAIHYLASLRQLTAVRHHSKVVLVSDDSLSIFNNIFGSDVVSYPQDDHKSRAQIPARPPPSPRSPRQPK